MGIIVGNNGEKLNCAPEDFISTVSEIRSSIPEVQGKSGIFLMEVLLCDGSAILKVTHSTSGKEIYNTPYSLTMMQNYMCCVGIVKHNLAKIVISIQKLNIEHISAKVWFGQRGHGVLKGITTK